MCVLYHSTGLCAGQLKISSSNFFSKVFNLLEDELVLSGVMHSSHLRCSRIGLQKAWWLPVGFRNHSSRHLWLSFAFQGVDISNRLFTEILYSEALQAAFHPFSHETTIVAPHWVIAIKCLSFSVLLVFKKQILLLGLKCKRFKPAVYSDTFTFCQ